MKTNFSLLRAAGVAIVLGGLLAACGGSDDKPGTTMPTQPGSSADAFTTQTRNLAATQSDDAAPSDISTIAVTDSDSAEPVAL
ncbi:hypothetical protein [Chitinimonas sp.]|uniref:hypothetical protein n=1 Tax=Chitinimonas sp. TaxID=1934313 RepID=UPI0035AEF7AF